MRWTRTLGVRLDLSVLSRDASDMDAVLPSGTVRQVSCWSESRHVPLIAVRLPQIKSHRATAQHNVYDMRWSRLTLYPRMR
jgi:hypothetical protein